MHEIPSEENPIVVLKDDLATYVTTPRKIVGGGVLFCVNGRATITIDTRVFHLKPDVEVQLFPGDSMLRMRADENFQAVLVLVTRTLFEGVCFRLDVAQLAYIKRHPFFRHDERTRTFMRLLFAEIYDTYEEHLNDYRVEIIRNHLRNIFLHICDKIQRDAINTSEEESGRKMELFHRFAGLVSEHFATHRDVAFYADALCISMSYLASVTRTCVGKTPKYLIDNRLVQEIKIQLAYTELSLQQIASGLNFPDQSYFARFFKRYTGCSPIVYRRELESGIRQQDVGKERVHN